MVPSVKLGGFFAFLRKYALFIIAGIGFGVCRTSLDWATGIAGGFSLEPFTCLSSHSMTDIGKLAGIVIYVFLAYRFDANHNSMVMHVMPSVLLAIGCIMTFLFSAGGLNNAVSLATGCFILGFGATALLMQWLEVLGCVSPRDTILALSIGYLANFLLSLAILDETSVTVLVIVVLFSASSFILVSYCLCRIGDYEWIRTPAFDRGFLLPLLFLLIAFSFAYGIGDSFTNLGYSTLSAKIGGIIPAVVVLFGMLLLKERMDLRVVYIITLPLMVAGLILAIPFDSTLWIPQILLSASIASCYILCYTLVCMTAHQDGRSSMLSSGIVRASVVAFALAGFQIGSDMTITTSFVEIGVTILAIVVVFCALMIRRSSFDSLFSTRFSGAENKTDELLHLADEKGLSEREKTIFLLLVDGKSAQEIASDLFITPGAVRAHISRIYGRFDIHSRKELDEMVERA